MGKCWRGWYGVGGGGQGGEGVAEEGGQVEWEHHAGMEVGGNEGGVGCCGGRGKAETTMASGEASDGPGHAVFLDVHVTDPRRGTKQFVVQLGKGLGVSMLRVTAVWYGAEEVVDSPGEGFVEDDVLGLQGRDEAEGVKVTVQAIKFVGQEAGREVGGTNGGAKLFAARVGEANGCWEL